MEKDLFSFITASKKVIKEYIHTRLSLLKIEVMGKVAHSIGLLFTFLTAALLIFLFVIFLGVTLSLWIGAAIGSYTIGFLIITAFFLLALIILLIFHRTLILTPFINLILSAMQDKTDDNDDDTETEKNIPHAS